jgi:hypothetical protein
MAVSRVYQAPWVPQLATRLVAPTLVSCKRHQAIVTWLAVAPGRSLPQVQTSCSSWPRSCVALSIFDPSPRQLPLGSGSACSRRGNREQDISPGQPQPKKHSLAILPVAVYTLTAATRNRRRWPRLACPKVTSLLFCLRALSASLSARLPPPPRGKSDLTRASHSADGEMSRNNGVQSTRPLSPMLVPVLLVTGSFLLCG